MIKPGEIQKKAREVGVRDQQIKDLPDFEQVERETVRHLRNLKI
ncbi:hypothetical protein ES708_17336 [subsurface metagenome]